MPVAGLGEGAFYVLDPGRSPVPPLSSYASPRGDRVATLDVETGEKPNIDTAVKFAKIACARLQQGERPSEHQQAPDLRAFRRPAGATESRPAIF